MSRSLHLNELFSTLQRLIQVLIQLNRPYSAQNVYSVVFKHKNRTSELQDIVRLYHQNVYHFSSNNKIRTFQNLFTVLQSNRLFYLNTTELNIYFLSQLFAHAYLTKQKHLAIPYSCTAMSISRESFFCCASHCDYNRLQLETVYACTTS